MTGRRRAGDSGQALADDLVVSVQEASKWYLVPKRWKPPRYLRWVPTKPMGGAGFDEDDLDDQFADVIDEAPTYGERGLRPLSFDLPAGAGLGLVGPDEIAKDTLIRILARFVPPQSGRVLVRGRISPLLTFYLQKFMKSAGHEALLEIARFMGWPISLVRERMPEITAFARLNELTDLAPDVYISLLTRRLVLSTALHVDASLYLVTHRFTRDDVAFGEHCFELLAQRRREGAVVVCTGDLDEVEPICDRFLWFEKGEVVAQGTADEVRAAVAGHPTELEATLVHDEPVVLRKAGDAVDAVIDGLELGAEIRFSIKLTDGDGHVVQLDQPAPYRVETEGSHRLTVRFPAGAIPPGARDGVLVATIGAGDSGERDLLAFAVTDDGDDREVFQEPDLGFQTLPAFAGQPVGEVEWHVRPVAV